MNEATEVCLTLTLGPIYGLGDAGIEANQPLWDSIIAAERFPPGAGTGGANYVLSVRKRVSQASDVRPAESELADALRMLAAAWPFSGGSYLPIETREIICAPSFVSNAEELEQEMLARLGRAKMSMQYSAPLEFGATYTQAPLSMAARIASAMHCDYKIRQLLNYHQISIIERTHPAKDHASWFISLYKVRDFLSKLYGKDRRKGAARARKELKISSGDWCYFGKILNNNDLRHAEIYGTTPAISCEDQRKLYELARSWVASYLRKRGLPAT